MDSTFKLASISLCTGGRGLDRGVERGYVSLRNTYRNEEDQSWDEAGRYFRYAAYVENEAVAAYNLVALMEQGLLDPAPVWTDLRTFPWDYFYGKVHILTGGYPCTPFSQAGLQKGTSDPRHLFPYIEHGIDAIRPVCCFFENVANHLNIGFREVRERLHRLGYKVEAGIFSAQQVGAPHLRKRLFILAVADTYCTEQSKRRRDFAEVLGLQETERQSEHSPVVSGRNGSELGNTHSQRFGKEGGEFKVGIEKSGDSMDNPIKQGLERHHWSKSERLQWQSRVRSIASSSLWPAGQGIYQHEWEEPRLESRMGLSVDGYDFTEDLLRIAGNAVVEQQAQLAFWTLMQKFL